MTAYSFIATDYEIPEIDNTKKRFITVREAIALGIKPHELVPWERMDKDSEVTIVDDENDLDELVIKKETDFENDVRWYTKKPFIYSVYFRYREHRGKQLLEYLKENIKEGQHLELWSIWLGDKQYIKPIICEYERISLELIKKVYTWQVGNDSICNCVVFERKLSGVVG
ncbi:hypothetical protein [Heliophilum fasciatum]|uniref:Uncharacterized protein n=1 Tax=Heliophilum fasciatum TaxID=35700 RepID=A0A4R2RMQ1_9FIRM|nr:hypothetical protein [Heliophilum fasciatum]MCW2279277.1 hypothetical protein [Heliophilum fasciatum]TCP60475.1 hypothetical protein EDD73_1363 [Heliophilum fasciatum]